MHPIRVESRFAREGRSYPFDWTILDDRKQGAMLVVATVVITSLDGAALPEEHGHVQRVDRFQEGQFRMPSDLARPHSGTQLLVRGSVRLGAAAGSARFDFAVGAFQHHGVLFGERRWLEASGRWVMSEAKTFETLVLSDAVCYGGSDAEGPFEANPSGIGFVRVAREASGARLPQWERAEELVGSPADRPEPAGPGPLAPWLERRRRLAGTYDDAWKAERAPLLPADFDPAFHDCSRWIHRPRLRGGERVEIGGDIAQSVSALVPRYELRLRASTGEAVMGIDSLEIDLDSMRMRVCYAATLPVPPPSRSRAVIFEKTIVSRSSELVR